MEPQPSIEPKKPSPLPVIILAILLLFSLVASGFLYYQNTQLYQLLADLNTSQKPAPSPKIAVNPTPSWKDFSNNALQFSLSIPQDVQVVREENTEHNRFVSLKNDSLNLEVSFRASKTKPTLDNYFFMDTPIKSTTTLAGQKANVYELPQGYCDGPSCSLPYLAIVTTHNNDYVNVLFSGDTVLSPVESQILSTFKFTQDNSFLYQLSIPSAWEGKYTLTKTATSATYTFTSTKSYPLFSLHKVTSSEWAKMQSMPMGGIQLLTSKNDYVYYASTSLDNPLSSPDSQKYQSMSANIPAILKTFIPN